MRKSFDGLTGIVQNELKADPLSAAIFIFLNRRRNQVKLLLWEEDGFSLYHKRLEKGDTRYEMSFLGHLRLIAPVSARHNILMEVLQFYLCGNLSSDTVQLFETAYKEKFANYGSRI
jgi:transposase